MQILFLKYIIEDIILLDLEMPLHYELRITDNHFEIKHEGILYQENLFHSDNIEINDADIYFLDQLHNYLSKNQFKLNEIDLTDKDTSLLKLIYFFSNERYFKYPLKKDKHDRIAPESIDKRYNKYLDVPITDILIRLFLKKFNVSSKSFRVNFTCDFDILHFWEYLGFIEASKKVVRNILKLNFRIIKKEIPSILFEKTKLKYNYFLNSKMFPSDLLNKNILVTNIGFIHLLQSNPKFDAKNNFNTKAFKCFHEELKSKNVILGLHPSYGSSTNKEILEKQMSIFETIFGYRTALTRFHYLKCNFPEDLSLMEEIGVKVDYSFGFVGSLIFRGGITKSFKMWNCKTQKAFDLKLIPLILMDGTFTDYLNSDLEESTLLAVQKIKKVEKYGFQLTLLWHNRSMYQYGLENNILPNLFKNIVEEIKSIDFIQ